MLPAEFDADRESAIRVNEIGPRRLAPLAAYHLARTNEPGLLKILQDRRYGLRCKF